ncbi:hypothetical protein [Nostoc cycadae]|nr:hypothetical protein [Nostoc cycadae]
MSQFSLRSHFVGEIQTIGKASDRFFYVDAEAVSHRIPQRRREHRGAIAC